MAAKLASAFVEIGTRDRKFRAGLQGVRSTLVGFVRKMAPVAAGLGVALGLKSSIDSIREQIQAERKLEAVLRATGNAAGLTANEIKKLAADLQKVTNFGDETTIAAAGILATFKQIKGDQFKDLLAVAQDVSSVMGTSLQSSVLQLGKAMNDPATGLTMLTRVGITFSEGQKEQIKLLTKSGDIMGAQGIILGELRSQFGGAARAMVDPMTQAKNVLGDVAETIGSLVLPSVNALAEGFLSLGGPVGDMRGKMEDLGQDIAFMFKNLGTVVKITALGWAVSILEAVPLMEKPLQDVAVFFTSTFAGLGAFFDTIVANIIGGFKEIKNFAVAIGAGISAAFEKIKTGDFTGVAGAFGDAFTKELAGQIDVEAPNAFKAFEDAAGKSADAMRKKFKVGGGLLNLTKTELAKQQQVLADAALKEEEEKEKKEFGAIPGEEEPGIRKETEKKKESFGLTSAKELQRQIQLAVQPSKEQRSAIKMEKNTAAIAKTAEKLTKKISEIDEKLKGGFFGRMA